LSEDGIAQALRQMEHAGAEPPTKISQVMSDDPLGTSPQMTEMTARSAPKPSDPPAAAATATAAVDPRNLKDSGAFTRFAISEPSGASWPLPGATPEAPPVPPPAEVAAGPSGSGFSLADLWPDAERERVRQAEAMLAARDAVNAILACDVLVTRVLASAAGLVGTLDAPRDPALVALLLGLDGTRYLHFRTVVRAARHREPVTIRDAFECFTFSLEARRSREALRR
jgi:hypothetical protein